jgi:hypothetical protein
MARKLEIEVDTSARFFHVGRRMYGVFGSFRIAGYKTLFLIFYLFRTKYIFTVDNGRTRRWTR